MSLTKGIKGISYQGETEQKPKCEHAIVSLKVSLT